MRVLRNVAIVLGGLALFVATFGAPSRADDSAKGETPKSESPKDDVSSKDQDKVEEPDPFAVPEEAGSKELLELIQKLQRRRPQGESRDELIKDYLKAQRAIIEAAQRIIASDAGDDEKAVAMAAKFQAVGLMARLGDREMTSQLTDSLDKVIELVKNGPRDEAQFRLALTLAQALEYAGETQAAAKAYRQFADLFADNKNERISQYAAKLQGVARRLNLLGNPIQLSGTLLDGTDLDWNAYKGKVVLVDFWATWCGPCVHEIPNVKANYAKYHDRGFDVVGVSLDDNAEKVEQFLEDQEIPWVTLFSADAEHNGWSHPMAEYYGVNAIPTVILVGKDGKVVDLQARGKRLGELLEELLGPADEAATDSKETKKD